MLFCSRMALSLPVLKLSYRGSKTEENELYISYSASKQQAPTIRNVKVIINIISVNAIHNIVFIITLIQ